MNDEDEERSDDDAQPASHEAAGRELVDDFPDDVPGVGSGRPERLLAEIARAQPDVADAFRKLCAAILGKLDARPREIVVLRVAARVGATATYVWQPHVNIGLEVGLDGGAIARIAAIDAPPDDTVDGVVVRATDEILADGVIDAETRGRLERAGIAPIDLLLTAQTYRTVATIVTTFALDPEPGFGAVAGLASAAEARRTHYAAGGA
jgi:hypothetical protein